LITKVNIVDLLRKSSLVIILLMLLSEVQGQPLNGIEIPDGKIKSIMIYQETGGPYQEMQSPAAPLEEQRLVVEFDDLRENSETYYAKILHCDHRWSRSRLRDLDFLAVYNEFNLNDFAFSNDTHIPYVHFRFPIPEVKLPGNYILLVYRDGDLKNLAFSRRFMVFSNQMMVAPMNRPGQGTLYRNLQEINFSVSYAGLNIPDPTANIFVVVRQNNRWDNALYGLTPSRTDTYRENLEFQFFDQRSAFRAGNEFRFVDFSSLNFPGRNTGYVDKSKKPFHVFVGLDRTRGSEAYAQFGDLNGNFIAGNRDFGNGAVTGQYVYVHFKMEQTGLPDDAIYVGGNWSDWSTAEGYRMKPAADGTLEAMVLLKQGYYDYCYFTQQSFKSGNPIEGDHSMTENSYEILVYNRNFQSGAEMLMGYSRFSLNGR